MLYQSQLDPLTGLLTRAAFETEFRSYMNTATQTGQPVSLAFLDIDYFLRINQEHGHEGGDRVLKVVAEIFSEHAGENAIVARYGGDEFALLYPYTEREQAFLILEGIRSAVEDCKIFGSFEASITITQHLPLPCRTESTHCTL